MRQIFLPGYGASGRLYASGLGARWEPLDPPSFRTTGGSLAAYVGWTRDVVEASDGSVWLAGHSFGGALALLAAAADPRRVGRLTLLSPAGLPLRKPIPASLAQFASQVVRGRYDLGEVWRDVKALAAAPAAALQLARAVRSLDLRREMRRVREGGVAAEVVGCTTDTLVTPRHCRANAKLLGAEYRELDLEGGHMWMLTAWPTFAGLF